MMMMMLRHYDVCCHCNFTGKQLQLSSASFRIVWQCVYDHAVKLASQQHPSCKGARGVVCFALHHLLLLISLLWLNTRKVCC